MVVIRWVENFDVRGIEQGVSTIEEVASQRTFALFPVKLHDGFFLAYKPIPSQW